MPLLFLRGFMELSVLERIMLLDILPQQGDFSTLKIVRKLRESLSFSEEEYKKFGFTQEEGTLHWQNNEAKDIKIGEKANDIIVESLKKLSNDKKLKQDQITLYERFVENKKSQED